MLKESLALNGAFSNCPIVPGDSIRIVKWNETDLVRGRIPFVPPLVPTDVTPEFVFGLGRQCGMTFFDIETGEAIAEFPKNLISDEKFEFVRSHFILLADLWTKFSQQKEYGKTERERQSAFLAKIIVPEILVYGELNQWGENKPNFSTVAWDEVRTVYSQNETANIQLFFGSDPMEILPANRTVRFPTQTEQTGFVPTLGSIKQSLPTLEGENILALNRYVKGRETEYLFPLNLSVKQSNGLGFARHDATILFNGDVVQLLDGKTHPFVTAGRIAPLVQELFPEIEPKHRWRQLR